MLYSTAALLCALVVQYSCMFELANCSSNVTDQSALLAFKSSINLDPNNVLSNWTRDTNFCGWAGVLCSKHRQRVTSLVLDNLGLQGTISPHLGNLSFLQLLDLRNNSFTGHLPDEIGQLSRLKSLVLQNNMLEGLIPVGLYRCRRLLALSLAVNNFTGGIPKELSTLPFIRNLYLGQNNLTGTIPQSFGNTTSLLRFGCELNHLHGTFPTEIAQLPNLKLINFGVNNLTGLIPPGIFNQSSMIAIHLNFNAFYGELPITTGLWLPNITILYLHFNKLTGNVPSFLSNATNLSQLYLINNSFTGTLPRSLGNLKYLEGLDVSNCQLTGEIPPEIGNLGNLNRLALINNNLNGTIPSTIGQLERLQRLYLSGNKFSGSIPNEICHLRNLGEIYLDANKLSGSIPDCIVNLSTLQTLDFDSNNLTLIPSSLWNLQSLRLLNLSYNSFGGSLDPNIMELKVLEIIDLSWNKISGNIPNTSTGSFQSLTYLDLSRNSFFGPIPNSLSNLRTLDFLDLSHNNLSGTIPKSLEALPHLLHLNLSYNKLSGEIPSGGSFTNFTAESFMDNEALCGKLVLQVPPCATHSFHKPSTKIVLLRYVLPSIVMMIIFVSLVYILKWNRGKKVRSQQSNDLFAAREHTMISYNEIRNATNNFCDANLLGEGSYGSVYKGVFSDGTIVAVKILNLQLEGAFKSFDAECEVLRNTRHRNLVRVITTCSNLELRALVLQYMSNGSLEKWLYSHNYCLTLLQRVTILIDVALALEYLHYGQSEPVVHCDLKPSNVLLDEDMVAHIADFGIAKILAENTTAIQTKTLGTLGYIAPEYGSEGKVSTSGDIYSYGMMLLEMFTRKKPTDEMFTGEVSLRQWVRASVPDRVMEVVDSGLLRTLESGGDTQATLLLLLHILELGLECSGELPTERSDIREVVGKLHKIQKLLLRVQSN